MGKDKIRRDRRRTAGALRDAPAECCSDQNQWLIAEAPHCPDERLALRAGVEELPDLIEGMLRKPSTCAHRATRVSRSNGDPTLLSPHSRPNPGAAGSRAGCNLRWRAKSQNHIQPADQFIPIDFPFGMSDPILHA